MTEVCVFCNWWWSLLVIVFTCLAAWCMFYGSSLLITPIQRLPRYRLLMGEILKYTPVNSPDRRAVEKVHDKVCEIATSVVRVNV